MTWVQLHNKKQLVGEIDVVGTRKRLGLIALQTTQQAIRCGRRRARRHGSSLPRPVAPRGSHLLWRGRVDNWVVARFVLDHPERISINQLNRIAPRFFQRTPQVLLVFVQHAPR